MFVNIRVQFFCEIMALQGRTMIIGSSLQNWFPIRSFKLLKIGVKHVTNSPNHNIEDIYVLQKMDNFKY